MTYEEAGKMVKEIIKIELSKNNIVDVLVSINRFYNDDNITIKQEIRNNVSELEFKIIYREPLNKTNIQTLFWLLEMNDMNGTIENIRENAIFNNITVTKYS